MAGKMSTQIELRNRVESGQAIIGVIGLGYVGLPVACLFAEAGFRVVGIDIRAERIRKIASGENPIGGKEPGLDDLLEFVVREGRLRVSSDYSGLAECDVILVNVETPVDSDHRPRYEALKTACTDLGAVMKDGALVIIESTVSPGTTERFIRPLLETGASRRANQDFYLGVCPERVTPGKLLSNMREMSRVCGGSTLETAETMAALYRHIVEANLELTDTLTAEVVKTTENAYRDVQIAFANEVALICEAVGADAWRVRELVNKAPMREMHFPGAGVGGHCIPKDPWLLVHGANGQVPVRLIPQARAVNDGMPLHVAHLLEEALRVAGIRPSEATVAILGYSYLENSDDGRNSPSATLVTYLRRVCREVKVHDPWVAGYQGDVPTVLSGSDAAVLMVAHRDYRGLELSELAGSMRTPILIDGRHAIERAQAEAAGFYYRCLGQAQPPA
jgi:UDP-N-acetyl-D-mannosaminuronic acid dehydrogenase